MELEFDITQPFNEDINKLSNFEKEAVINQINSVSQSLLKGQTAFKENSYVPYIFSLKGGLDSSLFLIRVNQDKRVVAAVDEDPIFNKISLTLFRLIDKNQAEKVYKEVGKALYSKLGIL